MAELISASFGVQLGIAAFGAPLASLGLAPQHTHQCAYQRESHAIERWQWQIFPVIARKVRKQGGKEFPWDESGLRIDALRGRTWGARNEISAARRAVQRQSISAASPMNAKVAFSFCTYCGAPNAELSLTLLKWSFRGQRKAVDLVVDGQSTNRKACGHDYVVSTHGPLTMPFRPGCAPDLDCDELISSHVKRTNAARCSLRSGETLHAKIEKQLIALNARPPPFDCSFVRHLWPMYATGE